MGILIPFLESTQFFCLISKKFLRRLNDDDDEYHQFCTWTNYSLSCRSFCLSLPLSTSKNFFLHFPLPQSIQNTFWEKKFCKKLFLKEKKNQKKLFILFFSIFFFFFFSNFFFFVQNLLDTFFFLNLFYCNSSFFQQKKKDKKNASLDQYILIILFFSRDLSQKQKQKGLPSICCFSNNCIKIT